MPKGDLTIVLNEREFQEFNRRLAGLDNVEQRTAITNALKQGMGVIVAQGKANWAMADLHTDKKDDLKQSFGVKLNSKKKVWSASYGGFRRPKGAAAHLVDRGTKKRYTIKTGAYRGSVQKRGEYTGSRFWTKAVESKGTEAVNTLMATVRSEVIRIMNGR